MRIDYLAIWTDNIELMRKFYKKYFGAIGGEKYENNKRNFTSYFLLFDNHETCIELMRIPDMEEPISRGNLKGLAHFTISVGSKESVNNLTEVLRKDGYTIMSEPRTTGDGYYECLILDPEGNHLKIVE